MNYYSSSFNVKDVFLVHQRKNLLLVRVGFANQVGSAPLDWTLGAFIKQTAEEPETGPVNVAHIIGDDTVTYLSLFAILCLVILAAFIIANFRKPKLKTVYDLEKGRYIVTRVSR